MTLTKAVTLEYMANRTKAITAKELSIDLDSRASTASELLERMTAQGLCMRDPKQRPREYALTPSGRERLAWLRAQAGAASQSGGDGAELHPLGVMPAVNGSSALTVREV
jgi:DNA-binding MarR family transcriptional regulator